MWKKKLYIRNNLEPYPISRTKIELFNNCRKCFYNDITYGVRRPHGPPLVLNNALHQIMTQEFDDYRKKKIVHPIMPNEEYEMLPSSHSNLISWRNPFSGIRYLHKKTNFQLIGAVDDLWFDNKSKKYFVVTYKSTSKKNSIKLNDINESHWKQLSFYNYLLKKNNLNISEIGFIIYLNAEKRGHVISRISLNPTFGNIILWRTVYESDGYYFVDAVYMPLFSKPLIKQGEKAKVIDKDSVFPSIRTESKHRNDIKRFSHFSNDFIYIHPKYKNIIADLRYGTLPHDVYSLWGIKIDSSNQDQHVEYINLRKFKKNQYKTFWNMLNGKLQEYN